MYIHDGFSVCFGVHSVFRVCKRAVLPVKFGILAGFMISSTSCLREVQQDSPRFAAKICMYGLWKLSCCSQTECCASMRLLSGV